MKNLFLMMLVALFSVHISVAQVRHPEPVVTSVSKSEQNDKKFMLDYYQQSLDNLKKATAGLTEEQLKFKPAADRWSISQCLEHIVLTEQMIFEFAKKGVEGPANPERRTEIKLSDKEVIAGMTDRSHKAKAPEQLVPEGKYTDVETAIADLEQTREPILDYINAVPVEDLRNHVGDTPVGAVDSYQSFLYIAGHTARHTKQIEEIKADENFSKATAQ